MDPHAALRPKPCDFLTEVTRQQHSFRLFALLWVICLIAFLIATRILRVTTDRIIYAVFYLSICFLYIPLLKVTRLRCPYCQGFAGVNPFPRYRSFVCRACGQRIECHQQHKPPTERTI
jgi:hypothetical protein